ncbi:hypothetical protein [Massilia pseudoviolaceinigra]|uniref:hypothetical protein n=1 Tax=Massilia pseudoviolaceinigra TaxID=3057165 RepID=UPI0027966659|nr:hypothetical protein [Massilia sp. CCM 9206]MDQ1921094.1 hypothetical protein [Massilia sp. CCM 9206]
MDATRSAMSALARALRRWVRAQVRVPAPASPAGDDTGFDHFSRSLGSQVARRDVMKVALFGAVSALLGSVGMKQAWAAANCLCARQLYDVATQCCTPAGVRPKHPLADLASCPERVAHPGYVCRPNGCGAAGGQSFPGAFGAARFGACCDGHDCCWGSCNSNRPRCDGTFIDCLRDACDAAYPPRLNALGLDSNRIRRSSCRATARAYFEGVQTDTWGTPAYLAAQQAACDCCGTQTCKTCPGGTCEALPSCEDPGCVCFQTIEGAGFCHRPQPCAALSGCTSSASCPSGWACVSVTCCGSHPVCIQPCFVVGGARVSPFGAAPAAGPTTARPATTGRH